MKEYKVLRYFVGEFVNQQVAMETNLNAFAHQGWQLKAAGWTVDTCTLILEREATPPPSSAKLIMEEFHD